MLPLFVLFLVAPGVAYITAVSTYTIFAVAEGTTKCNGAPFGRNFFDKGNVSIIHRRYAGTIV